MNCKGLLFMQLPFLLPYATLSLLPKYNHCLFSLTATTLQLKQPSSFGCVLLALSCCTVQSLKCGSNMHYGISQLRPDIHAVIQHFVLNNQQSHPQTKLFRSFTTLNTNAYAIICFKNPQTDNLIQFKINPNRSASLVSLEADKFLISNLFMTDKVQPSQRQTNFRMPIPQETLIKFINPCAHSGHMGASVCWSELLTHLC